MEQKTLEELREHAHYVREQYRAGLISRGEAKEQLSEYIVAFDAKCKEIADKYGQKPKKFNLGEFLRSKFNGNN